jgi:hypothetical protein
LNFIAKNRYIYISAETTEPIFAKLALKFMTYMFGIGSPDPGFGQTQNA